MAHNLEDSDQLRLEAEACRRIASQRALPSRGAALLTVAHYFEAHAKNIDRLRARGW